MSRKCSTWADKHVVGRDGAQRLLEAIADWCNDDGVTFVGQKKLQYKVAPMPLSSVKANFKYLKDRGYIRTEQRHNPVTKARMTDIIYLNLEKWDTQKISFEEAEEVMKQTGMSLDELMKSPLFLKGAHQHYIDMHSGPGLKNLPGFSNPTQAVENSVNDQGLENLPWSSQVDFTGDQGRFYSSEGGSRVNRNARAQINLKIKDSSISQSVKSSGSVENSDGSTDGWTRNKTSKPLESANPARMKGPVAARQEYLPSVYHRGVDISRVRSNLVHAGIPAKQTSDNQLIFMIDLVLDRASGPVRSPNGFVTTALKNGWYELVSQAEEKSLNSDGSGALCRQHRCYLSVTGECKRCIAEQRAAELDDLHHELVWKKNLTQIDVATLEVSLRHGGYAIDSVSVQDFGQYIMAALNSGISPTNNDLFRYFADNQEIFTPDAASDKEFAGFGYERTA
ncbi:hypothetical protein [Rothia dentocariosa]|uniref:hypothetical protein n=1 Tax=Rothia dentocariosa TaxID=2047 RepID=UPI0028E8D043|nr:hypothetical protein [Rothia dentocariosa]